MLKGKKIGEGTYGKVYSATSRSAKGDYAVKRNLIERPLDFAGSVKELDILNKLQDHPHIVRIEFMSVGDPFIQASLSPLRCEYKDDKIHFIFPLADGDLDNIISDRKYGYAKAQQYMVHILLGVEYMHSKGIIHRDLKPHNILDFKGTMQICDFGLAKPFSGNGSQSPRVVTSWYRAPEVTMGDRFYDYKIDVWSVGCIMYELIAKTPFVSGVSDRNNLLLDKITTRMPNRIDDETFKRMLHRGDMSRRFKQKERKRRYTWDRQLFGNVNPDNFDKDAFIDMLSHALEFDPKKRWTITDLLNHRFFDNHRRYINEVRRDIPPEADPLPRIKCINCNERKWAIQMAYSFFNDRHKYDWYSHSILFQAIDIFDRYLLYLNRNTSTTSRQNSVKGLFLDNYRAKLSFLVCMYLSIKYFAGAIYPVSFSSIAEHNFRTTKALKIADELESNLIKEILEYQIYRKTVYDVVTRPMDDYDVIELLYVVGELYYLDPTLSVAEVYSSFEIALKSKRSKKAKND